MPKNASSWRLIYFEAIFFSCTELKRRDDIFLFICINNPFCSSRDSQVCWIAVRNGHLEVLNFLRANEAIPYWICNKAAKYGPIEVMNWALEFGGACTKHTAELIALRGDLKMYACVSCICLAHMIVSLLIIIIAQVATCTWPRTPMGRANLSGSCWIRPPWSVKVGACERLRVGL